MAEIERKQLQKEGTWLLGFIAVTVLLVNGKQIIHSIAGVLEVFQPFGIGIAIAFMFDMPYNFLRKKYRSLGMRKAKVPDVLALLTVYIAAIVIIAAIVGVVIPQFVKSISSLIENADMYLNNWEMELNAILQLLNLSTVDLSDLIKAIVQGMTQLSDKTGEIVSTLLSATGMVINWIATGLIAIVFSIYLLAGKERILGQSKRLLQAYLPNNVYRYLQYVLNIIITSFENYLIGQSIEAVIFGSLCFIGMLILRLEYASLISVVVGITAWIPVLGAYIGGTIAVALLLMVSPVKAGIFLLFYVVLQQIENKMIYPQVVGRRIGLSGIWVLLAIMVGTKLGGIIGAILSVPIASIVYTLLKDGVIHREKNKHVEPIIE